MSNNENIFSTSDLPLATYLRCKGIPIAKEYNSKTKEWSFEKKEECNTLALELTNSKAMVNVLEYEMHRKNLLSLAKKGNGF